ncbi:MAG: hypothetical protein ACM3TN_01520 [Alphaproteobacteria bacterium]
MANFLFLTLAEAINGITIVAPRGWLKNAMIRIASGKTSKADFAKFLRKLLQLG